MAEITVDGKNVLIMFVVVMLTIFLVNNVASLGRLVMPMRTSTGS